MLRLILLRHGQSEADISGRHEGRADFELTSLGKEQAKALANYLSTYFGIDEVYCSPLKRAKETAQILGRKIMRQPIEVDQLLEINNGDLAGLTFEEAEKRFPPQSEEKIYRPLPNGESTIDFRFRIELFWHKFKDENLENNRQKTVCIVAHGGTISMLYKAIFKLPVNTNIRFPTSDTGFHVFEITKKDTILLKANSVEHLYLKSRG
ncbi:histidine phosphatase family protein [Proteinivorax hydrogeniformans]|uniref:Histidine phosphatase family protein n=1 Tax=Proteinivorax hydrogeniformans TaxID=1826727 RepID=A0AAU8HS25_9FIRM